MTVKLKRNPTLTVGLVAAFAGLLFAASAQMAHNPVVSTRQPQNLAQLVNQSSDRVAILNEAVAQLNAEVDTLALAVDTPIPEENTSLVTAETAAIGFLPVSGPGITVSLDDAPASSLNIPGVTSDDLVIHQQDLQAVISALWAGGAEAITLMGERVTMTSAFRCTGNVLLLHGRVFSPPFVVQAIGNPDTLHSAVMSAEGVRIFLQYVDHFGLGFAINGENELHFPAYTGSGTLNFATLPDDENPFRTS